VLFGKSVDPDPGYCSVPEKVSECTAWPKTQGGYAAVRYCANCFSSFLLFAVALITGMATKSYILIYYGKSR